MSTPMINVHTENPPHFEDITIEVGTKLFTRDGRTSSNAIIIAHRPSNVDGEIYLVLEDSGNIHSMSFDQLEDHFIFGGQEILIENLNRRMDNLLTVMDGFADIFHAQPTTEGSGHATA